MKELTALRKLFLLNIVLISIFIFEFIVGVIIEASNIDSDNFYSTFSIMYVVNSCIFILLFFTLPINVIWFLFEIKKKRK